jgi:hypothetical protein
MSEAVFARLAELNVKFTTKKHAPVMTIDELLKESGVPQFPAPGREGLECVWPHNGDRRECSDNATPLSWRRGTCRVRMARTSS